MKISLELHARSCRERKAEPVTPRLETFFQGVSIHEAADA